MRALVTGGAGFIGSRLVEAFLAKGHSATILDSIDPSAHRALPPIPAGARFVQGDVRDPTALEAVLGDGCDVVFHEAALVGFGQGAADRLRFLDVNVGGTERLIDALGRLQAPPRVVLASSMAVYGEGAYRCPSCGVPRSGSRTRAQLLGADWESRCEVCGTWLTPVAVTEDHPVRPETAYAESKAAQETAAMRSGLVHGLTVVALRYHNVYGPGMPRNTPYAGVASLFKSRVLDGRAPLVHEDGGQLRDFVHVQDVVRANLLAAMAPAAAVGGQAFNIGSGRPVSILELAQSLVRNLAPRLGVEVGATFREGDARHVYGSIDKARRILGYIPCVDFERGFEEFAREPMRVPVRGVLEA